MSITDAISRQGREERTFLEGGLSASSGTAAPPSSASLSAVERFLPLADFGLGSCSSSAVVSASLASAGLAFLPRGFGGAFFGRSGFGCSFMREERRGSAGEFIVDAAATLRGIAGSVSV